MKESGKPEEKKGTKGVKVWGGRNASRKSAGRASRRRLRGRDLLILLIPVLVAAAVATVVYYFNRDLMQCTLEGSSCQYYAGSVYHLQQGMVLRRTQEDVTVLGEKGNETELSSLPIYNEEQREITLPQTMAYYNPRADKAGRLDYFSRLRCEEGGRIVAAREGDGETDLSPGFIFDGEDYYLFLEPVLVSINGYELALPAMSYVEARYNGFVTVFNYETKEFMMEEPQGAVKAQIEQGDYTLSLLSDSMVTYDGIRTLLVTEPNYLESVFGA